MNVVANHYYLQRFPDVEFYFEPLSDDSGVTIGAAKVFYHQKTQDKIIRPLKTTSFHGITYDISSYKEKTKSIKYIANLLNQDKSVAVYTGLAEAGQRALGNRSILFNALNPNAKDLVNEIKKREWYRPFACMVLEEDANIYFNMGRIKSSPFMTICFPVRPEYVKIIPGVTHIDNTCRVQTVSQDDGYLYKLLQEFKYLSGHGILLNTSFNLAGEPLVETPEDAFNTLNNSCLDYLWFEETQQLFKNKKSVSINYQ
jgi:carbamoyltransferase